MIVNISQEDHLAVADSLQERCAEAANPVSSQSTTSVGTSANLASTQPMFITPQLAPAQPTKPRTCPFDVKLKIFSSYVDDGTKQTCCIELPLSDNHEKEVCLLSGSSSERDEALGAEYKRRLLDFVQKGLYVKKIRASMAKHSQVVDKFSYCFSCAAQQIIITNFTSGELKFPIGILNKESVQRFKVLQDGNIVVLTDKKILFVDLVNNRIHPHNASIPDERLDNIASFSKNELMEQRHVQMSVDYIIANSKNLIEFQEGVRSAETEDVDSGLNEASQVSTDGDSASDSKQATDTDAVDDFDCMDDLAKDEFEFCDKKIIGEKLTYESVFFNKDYSVIQFTNKGLFPNTVIHTISTGKLSYFQLENHRIFFDVEDDPITGVQSKPKKKERNLENLKRQAMFDEQRQAQASARSMQSGGGCLGSLDNRLSGLLSGGTDGLSLGKIADRVQKSKLGINDIPADLLDGFDVEKQLLQQKQGISLAKTQKKYKIVRR